MQITGNAFLTEEMKHLYTTSGQKNRASINKKSIAAYEKFKFCLKLMTYVQILDNDKKCQPSE